MVEVESGQSLKGNVLDLISVKPYQNSQVVVVKDVFLHT